LNKTVFSYRNKARRYYAVGGNEVSLEEIRSGFEFVPGIFGIVLHGGYATHRTILIEFKFIVPEL